MARGKRTPGALAPGRGAEIMALRSRARRPVTRPGRSGRATSKRRAIQEASA